MWRGVRRQRHVHGGTFEEEVPGQARISDEAVGSSSCPSFRPRCSSRQSRRGRRIGGRGENCFLFLTHDPPLPRRQLTHDARAILVSSNHRCLEKWNAASGRRRIGQPLYCGTPSPGGRALAVSSCPGDVPARGGQQCRDSSLTQGPEAQEIGGEVTRSTTWMDSLWKGTRLLWQRERRMASGRKPERKQRKRERKERRLEPKRKRRKLEAKSVAADAVEGQDRRERHRSWERREPQCLEPRTGGVGAGKEETEDLKYPQVFEALAKRCTTLKKTGCALAWLIFNEEDVKNLPLPPTSKQRGAGSAVHQGRGRTASCLLPFRVGRLAPEVTKLKALSIDQVTTDDFSLQTGESAMTLAALSFLNRHSGMSRRVEAGFWNSLQQRAVGEVRKNVSRFLQADTACDRSPNEVRKELSERFLSYTGEEVPKMQPLSVDQVVKALPPPEHGGRIDLCNLVSHRTRTFLMNPNSCILEDDGRWLPKLQAKVHFHDGEKLKVSKLLVERGICCWTPLEDVITYRGQVVLNGLFAVGKGTYLEDGREIQRCIMNLIPSNAILCQLEGGVQRLPNICQWLSITLDEDEEIAFCQSDMSSAFYLFHLPPGWERLLSFNVVLDGKDVNGEPGRKYALSCRVLPMGWSSAVGVMQEVAEALGSIGKLPCANRVDRNKILPPWLTETLTVANAENKAWFHVYLDNFCSAEKVRSGEVPEGAALLHELIEESWAKSGVVSSAKKRVSQAPVVAELGAEVGGPGKAIGGSSIRFLRLVQVTLVVISDFKLKPKWIQMVAGRWVHVLQFRRPGMSVLDKVWTFIAGKDRTPTIERKVREELLLCCLGACLFHTHLGASVSRFTTASDASSTGGAVGISRALTSAGGSFAMRDHEGFSEVVRIPVLVLSLFNGVGGAFRAYDLCGVAPTALISYDTHGPANRVTSRRWPHAVIEKDVKTCTKEKMRQWMFKYPEIERIDVWFGFPCVDLSAVKAGRLNLLGPGSSLFYEVKRILRELKMVFGLNFEIRFVGENVSSMDVEAEQEISRELGRRPFFVNCSDAVPIQRPRFCWTNVDCELDLPGSFKEIGPRFTTIHLQAQYPEDHQWMEEGWERNTDTIYATCMKSIKRKAPPPRPAGLNRCDEATVMRWEANEFRYPPYQYADRFLFWKEGFWRLMSASEREILHGFGYDHTCLCFSASQIKQSYTAYEDERKSLIGDSFSLFSFVYFAAQLCRKWQSELTYEKLVLRMGMAPGYCAPLNIMSPMQRSLGYGPLVDALPVDFIHRALLRRVNHTGSDVRLSTGFVLNPKNYPRQSVQSGWWQWQSLFAYKWNKSEHINALELRSIIHAIQYRVTHLKERDARVFHLSDSYICISIISKGRSSSRMLNRLLKQLACCLASSWYCFTLKAQRTLQMKRAAWAAQRTLEERKAARANIRLADVGITARTQTRYYHAVSRLLPHLEGVSRKDDLDEVVSEWVETQFEAGAPLHSISDALSGLHHLQPWTKGLLVRSWKLFSIWRRHEVPMRAPPITQDVVLAFAGHLIHQGEWTMATLLVCGFHTMLRTYEMLGVRPCDFLIGPQHGIVTIPTSKSGVRHNVKESVTIDDPITLELCRIMVRDLKQSGLGQVPCWSGSAQSFRNKFYSLCSHFKIEHLKLKCYSIRRGGATYDWQQHGLMERTLLRGRWASTSVAKLYITDALSQIPSLTISTTIRRELNLASKVFQTFESDSRRKRG